MKYRLGFTVVEVIVVITMIAILAGVGAVTYTGVQRQAREDERIADIDVMASYLETYNEEKGHYPSFQTFYMGSAWNGNNTFPQTSGVPVSALTDPADTGASGPHYSYANHTQATADIGAGGYAALLNWPSTKTYTYLPFKGDPGLGQTASTICVIEECSRYILYYKDEQGVVKQVKSKYGN